jgi:tRNA A37 threonylcarbamoyladenosine biosynthesis protein TsaE
MDYPRRFTGEVKCGFYFVKTEQYFPFRGCGWYGEAMVKMGLETGMIEDADIIMEFIPSKTLKCDHFVAHVEYLIKAFRTEPKLQKLAVNTLVGLMGKQAMTSSFSKYTTDPYEAADWLEKYETHEVFIETVDIGEDKKLYVGILRQNVVCETSLLPIYKLVLEQEAIELYKLECAIERKGGIVLDRNTDAIRYIADKKIEIIDYWDDKKKVIKYHEDEPTPLAHTHAQFKRNTEPDFEKYELQWNLENDYADIDAKVEEIITGNNSIHIDGRAGCGKTFFMNKIVGELDKRGIEYKSFSPTNKGARLIGGKTIHSLYYKFRVNKKKLITFLEKTKYIFIDEVSMMHVKFYKLFLMIKMMFPNLRFIISGDMGQLLPVKDEWTGDYKNSPALFSLCDGNRIELTKCRRSNDILYNLCRNVMKISVAKFKPTRKTYNNLAFTHETRIRVNKECMERYITENKKKSVQIARDARNPKTQDIILMKGMPIIAHTNNKKKEILNSDQFIVDFVDDKIIRLVDGDRKIEIATKEFNRYFYLGFCITIHASQGATIEGVYTIYDWKHSLMCERARYVAMSRGTNENNIQIVE